MKKAAKQKQRDGFTFYRSFRDSIGMTDEADQLMLYKAIADYALDGIEPDTSTLGALGRLCWTAICPNIKSGVTNFRNGCNGGAPKGNKNAKKQPKNNPNSTEKQPAETSNENENGNENGNEYINKLSNESKESADKPHKVASKRTAFVAPPTENCSEDFLKFQQWVADNAPRVSQMKEPMTEEQLRRLKGKYSTEQICDILLRMHNYRRINDNISAYLTALNWLGRSPEFNNPKPTQQNERKPIYDDL